MKKESGGVPKSRSKLGNSSSTGHGGFDQTRAYILAVDSAKFANTSSSSSTLMLKNSFRLLHWRCGEFGRNGGSLHAVI
jgi:hypothetical protein